MIRSPYFAAPVALAASMLLGVAGCASQDLDEPLASDSRPIRDETRDDVPAGARLIKEGHEPLLYQVPSDGTVWVYNASDRRLVYTGAVRAGQSVHVDPDHDFVLVNGKKVVDMKMDDFDNHQILFAPLATGSQTTAIQPPAPAQAPGQAPAVIVQPNPVKIQQQPGEVRVKGSEVEVQPSGVKVVPQN
jgi:hypothetical protein